MTPTPKIAIAVPYSDGGNTSYSTAWAVASSAPPPRPCSTRQNTSSTSECELPQKNDAIVNSAIEPAK